MLILISALILGVLKGVIATSNNVNPIFGAYFWFLVPDLLFFAVITYWLFAKEKLKATPSLLLFLVAYLGSIVWDYQAGFYALKYFFPGILFLIINKDKLQAATLKDLFISILPYILLPLLFMAYSAFMKKSEPAASANPTSPETSPYKALYMRAIFFGVVIGLGLLSILAALDPEFVKFLNVNNTFSSLKFSIFALVSYAFSFLFYFFIPVRSNFPIKSQQPTLLYLVQMGLILIVSIVIGYTLYDVFILGRAFKFIELTYESVGKNTQLYFIELVVLGGMWLLLVSYALDRLHLNSDSKDKVALHVQKFLLISLLWLMPPVYNILRALISVYISQFGLTILRLFGIYTAVAFLLALIIVVINTLGKNHKSFSNSILSFSLALLIFCFALPNNLLVGNSLLTRSAEGKESDYNYFKKLKLEKWGRLLVSSLDGNKTPADNLWGLTIANRIKDPVLQKQYRENIKSLLKKDYANLISLWTSYKFEQLVNTYHSDPSSVSVYKGSPIPYVTLKFDYNSFPEYLYTIDHPSYLVTTSGPGYSFYDFGVPYVDFNITYSPPYPRFANTPAVESLFLSPGAHLEFNSKRTGKSLLIGDFSMTPFVMSNFGSSCTDNFSTCGTYSQINCKDIVRRAGIDSKTEIPKEFVLTYLDVNYKDGSCSTILRR